MKRNICIPLTFVCLLMSAGCGQQEESVEAKTPSVRMSTTTIHDPVTESEVQTFLKVLAALPTGTMPQFQPLSQVTASDRMSARQLAVIYRQEYRAMFDASRHGDRWRRDSQLMAAFEQNSVAPEDFAALMIRMSCAVTANSISPAVDLQHTVREADRHVEQIIQQIDALDVSERTSSSINQRSQALESLQDLVAFSEFARILVDVPRESCAVVARHREKLVRHLPTAGGAERFEQTIESSVVPTSFQLRDQTP